MNPLAGLGVEYVPRFHVDGLVRRIRKPRDLAGSQGEKKRAFPVGGYRVLAAGKNGRPYWGTPGN